MTINLKMPDIKELKPKITVFGVGGAGGNAVNNMIRSGLIGCEFVVANTDSAGADVVEGRAAHPDGRRRHRGARRRVAAGGRPRRGRGGDRRDRRPPAGSHMVFVTAGMGGGTGTGAAPVIARAAREQGILTVGVVTKPFQFEGVSAACASPIPASRNCSSASTR
jgi:cell division protein FtsZ